MRTLRLILLSLAALLTLSACNSRSAAIDRMVDELNSPIFRAQEAKTGLFDDSKAEIKENQLIITFHCRPFIDLSKITESELPQLRQSAIDEFRANVAVDDKFREGIEALNAENMTLLLVWQDINGATIRIPILPSAILPAS